MASAASTIVSGLLAGIVGSGITWTTNCNISTYVPSFPPNQTELVVPTGIEPHFFGLGFGVQNYTCASTNTYTNVGAYAELLDISCFVNASWFSTIQNEAYDAWTAVSQTYTIAEVIDYIHAVNPPQNLAQHYFVTNPVTGSGLSPKWDFTSSGKFEGNPNAWVIGKVNGTLTSPDDPTTDVTWLEVLPLEGEMASEIFRIDTVGGEPPSSCTYGESEEISVDYIAKYLFYGGSIN